MYTHKNEIFKTDFLDGEWHGERTTISPDGISATCTYSKGVWTGMKEQSDPPSGDQTS
jgi:hypothetical protein